MALTMRTIGGRDYTIYDDGQHVGRIHYAPERLPPRWVWKLLPTGNGLPITGAALGLEGAQADLAAAWDACKKRP
ncbi:hypothetical protein M2427_007331 [Bradyrhizobium sp. BR13661]|jgi:hypothetical protein|nr:hypothetical protein [Bradyrhizobium sp. BR13661]